MQVIIADQFLRAVFLRIFSCAANPSKPLAAPQALKVAFPLENKGVLRSQEEEGMRKEGHVGEGGNKGAKNGSLCNDNKISRL